MSLSFPPTFLISGCPKILTMGLMLKMNRVWKLTTSKVMERLPAADRNRTKVAAARGRMKRAIARSMTRRVLARTRKERTTKTDEGVL